MWKPMKGKAAAAFGLVVLLGLGHPSPAPARVQIPELPEVRELREQVPQVRQAEGSATVIALLEPLVLSIKNPPALWELALELYARELLLAEMAPERLLDLRHQVQDDWRSWQIGFRYWQLVVEIEKTPDGRIKQLIFLTETGGHDLKNSRLREWAAMKLCSLGVERVLRSIDEVLEEPDEHAYCRAQVAAVHGPKGGVEGMRRILKAEDPFPRSMYFRGKLHLWAASWLYKLGTAESLHFLAVHGASLASSDWERSQDIAHWLRARGWSEETLRLLGFRKPPFPRFSDIVPPPKD